MTESAEYEVPWATRIGQLLLPVLRHRIERLGVQESGAYDYYNVRVQQNQMFLGYEIALAHKLMGCGLNIRHVHEIGCGFGQLMFLLGWNGFNTLGFESERARGATAFILRDVLRLVDPQLTGNVELLAAEFPSDLVPRIEPNTLVLTTNVVATRSLPQQRAVLKEMRKYPFVIVDVQRFFTLRQDVANEPAALALFAEAGFQTPELFLDLGLGGRYYLFDNSSVQ